MISVLKKIFILSSICLIIFGCKKLPTKSASDLPQNDTANSKTQLSLKIIRSMQHDPEAYTQGLFVDGDILFESTGQYGFSSLRKVDINTGTILAKESIGIQYFGEGITLLNDKIYMLTWQSEKGFIFDKNSLKKIGEFSYKGEGWGIASDDSMLYMSDGSNIIKLLDPTNFQVTNMITVTYNGSPLNMLNELEIVGDSIYANIYTYDAIAIIDKNSGNVLQVLDAGELRKKIGNIQNAEVLNGIAYNPKNKRFILTGKNWDKYFEVEL